VQEGLLRVGPALPGDARAVRVEADHRDGGPPLVILMPYQRKGLVKKVVTYGQMAVSEGARRIWPSV